jgi:hypothetical protein
MAGRRRILSFLVAIALTSSALFALAPQPAASCAGEPECKICGCPHCPVCPLCCYEPGAAIAASFESRTPAGRYLKQRVVRKGHENAAGGRRRR